MECGDSSIGRTGAGAGDDNDNDGDDDDDDDDDAIDDDDDDDDDDDGDDEDDHSMVIWRWVDDTDVGAGRHGLIAVPMLVAMLVVMMGTECLDGVK